MLKEQTFFLAVISDFINRKNTVPSNGLDWDLVFDCFSKHQLRSLLYFQCKDFLKSRPEMAGIYDGIQKASLMEIYHFASLKNILSSVQNRLSKEEIPAFIIKGFEIAKYYPYPEFRSMGDIDLVVHESDTEKTHRSLINQGFKNISQGNHEWVYKKHGFEIELHNRLLYDHVVNKEEHVSYFIDIWQHVQKIGNNYKLDWNYHYIYMLIHLRKHLLFSGVGFRQFLDLAVVAKNNHELDWGWISEQLEKLHLLDFAKLCIGFCEKWFKTEFPIRGTDPDNEFYHEVTEKIFADGVFGFNNPENVNSVLMTEIHNKKPLFVMIKRVIWLFYPDYKSLAASKDYQFLQGKPLLLPFAWVLRHYYILTRKNIGEFSFKLRESVATREEIERKNNYLERWKL